MHGRCRCGVSVEDEDAESQLVSVSRRFLRLGSSTIFSIGFSLCSVVGVVAGMVLVLLVLVRGRVFMHDIFETFGLRKNVEGGLGSERGPSGS